MICYYNPKLQLVNLLKFDIRGNLNINQLCSHLPFLVKIPTFFGKILLTVFSNVELSGLGCHKTYDLGACHQILLLSQRIFK